jgi:hypothetical protein
MRHTACARLARRMHEPPCAIACTTPCVQGWRPVWTFPIDKLRQVEAMMKEMEVTILILLAVACFQALACMGVSIRCMEVACACLCLHGCVNCKTLDRPHLDNPSQGLTISADGLPPLVHKVMSSAQRLPDDSARYDRLKEVRVQADCGGHCAL